MGKLRTEPKHKSFLTQDEYNELLSVLRDAQKAANEHHIFWDLEEDEKPAQTKKAFSFVARKAGIDVTIRQIRGSRSLAFHFKKGRPAGASRMSANECRSRILKCLKSSKKPLKKNQIIKQTGVSPSTWNIRIKELLQEGLVVRHGDRRDTTYTHGKSA